MDAFKLLTKSGTSFDSKKFKSDIDLFNVSFGILFVLFVFDVVVE